jgi:sphinganine-1-phosphate aldolase
MDNFKAWLKSQTSLQLTEHAIVTLAALYLLQKLRSGKGVIHNVSRFVLSLIKSVPFAGNALNAKLDEEAAKAVSDMLANKKDLPTLSQIPSQGLSETELKSLLDEMKQNDVNPSEGRVFAYVYDSCDEKQHRMVSYASDLFLHANALNPMAFNSLRKMEIEIVRMCASMFHGDPSTVCGSVTTGGTESLALAVKTYRDRAKALNQVTEPELIMCRTGHPAINKACHSYGVKVVFVDEDEKTRQMRVDQVRAKITKNTICIIASAPQYPHGIVDPIEAIAAVAVEKNVPLHVDSCIGGFMLPWLQKLGYKIPKFDFEVAGVSSISADMHKYGYAAKGASVILYRNQELRKFQFYAFSTWPGGLYISPTILGSWRRSYRISMDFIALHGRRRIFESCQTCQRNSRLYP